MLLRLMDDLIDLSHGDLNELRLAAAEFSPREMLNSVIESVEKDASLKGIALCVELGKNIPLSAIGDAGRLKQILSNLIANALKFTHQGEIRVKMRGEPVENQTVSLEFAIEDTGIGIVADKLGDIFEPFSQAEEFVTARYGGSGLGLTISRQLVRQMGGHIDVQSSPGTGSILRFTVRLGVPGSQAPPVAASGRTEVTPSLLGDLSVLLAEDNDDNVFLVKAYLGPAVKLEIASNGREAVDKFIAGRFDIVLMDLRMPAMDGLQATRLIREWERHYQKVPTPILAYTADSDTQEDSLQAGCTAHLVKPLSQVALIAALLKYPAGVAA
jgi:CheY-like chemotaxis protein/two-component sensor histidine kinase